MFRNSLLPPSSGSKIKISKNAADAGPKLTLRMETTCTPSSLGCRRGATIQRPYSVYFIDAFWDFEPRTSS
jgi:hypothetical protein